MVDIDAMLAQLSPAERASYEADYQAFGSAVLSIDALGKPSYVPLASLPADALKPRKLNPPMRK